VSRHEMSGKSVPILNIGIIAHMFYVYVLISLSTDKLYIGHTNDIDRRLSEHNRGKSISTRNRGPWKLIGYITSDSRSEAMRIEKRLKSFKRSDRVLAYLANHSD